MTVTEAIGGGATYGDAIKSMLNSFKVLFTAYTNITFVERYAVDTSTNIYRDIYEVAGFDKFYIAFQTDADYNANIIFQIYEKADYHTNNPIFDMTWIGDGGIAENNSVYVRLKFYAIGDTALRGFTLIGYLQDVERQMVVFATSSESGNHYICTYNSALINSNIPTTYFYNASLLQYNISEQALKQNLILIDGDNYFDIIYGLDLYINSQFEDMTLALIQIGDKRYRQVFENYVFVED